MTESRCLRRDPQSMGARLHARRLERRLGRRGGGGDGSGGGGLRQRRLAARARGRLPPLRPEAPARPDLADARARALVRPLLRGRPHPQRARHRRLPRRGRRTRAGRPRRRRATGAALRRVGPLRPRKAADRPLARAADPRLVEAPQRAAPPASSPKRSAASVTRSRRPTPTTATWPASCSRASSAACTTSRSRWRARDLLERRTRVLGPHRTGDAAGRGDQRPPARAQAPPPRQRDLRPLRPRPDPDRGTPARPRSWPSRATAPRARSTASGATCRSRAPGTRSATRRRASRPRSPKSGLPIGSQLVAPPNGEGTILSLAAQIEAETGWPERIPPGYGSTADVPRSISS